MEYPRHLHKPGGLYVVIEDASQHEALTSKGWALVPPAHVEQPVEVRYYDAVRDDSAPASKPLETPSGDSLVADLSVEDAKPIILAADPIQLVAIEAEETAGKNRKGVLALIELRRADHLDD